MRSCFSFKKVQLKYSTNKLKNPKLDLDHLRRTEAEIFDTIYKEKKTQQFHRENLYLKKVYEEEHRFDFLKELLEEHEDKQNFYELYDTKDRSEITELIDTMQEELDPGRKDSRLGGPVMTLVHPNYENILERRYAVPEKEYTEEEDEDFEQQLIQNRMTELRDAEDEAFIPLFEQSTFQLMDYVFEVDKIEETLDERMYLTKKQKMQRRKRRSKRRHFHRRLENTIRAVAWHKKL